MGGSRNIIIRTSSTCFYRYETIRRVSELFHNQTHLFRQSPTTLQRGRVNTGCMEPRFLQVVKGEGKGGKREGIKGRRGRDLALKQKNLRSASVLTFSDFNRTDSDSANIELD